MPPLAQLACGSDDGGQLWEGGRSHALWAAGPAVHNYVVVPDVNGKPEVSLTGAAKGGMVKLVVWRGWELIPSPPRPRILI